MPGIAVQDRPEYAQDGSLHIIVFDSKFTDNSGDYEVKCRIIRKAPGESEDEIRADLLRRATPNVGRGFLDDRPHSFG